MRTVSIIKNGKDQTIRLPKEFEFEGVSELEITREGDALVLRPVRKSWESFASVENADADFLIDRPAVVKPGCKVLWKSLFVTRHVGDSEGFVTGSIVTGWVTRHVGDSEACFADFDCSHDVTRHEGDSEVAAIEITE